MSDIRRYIPYSTPIYLSGESSPEPTTCVVLGRDHERIVAEKNREIQHWRGVYMGRPMAKCYEVSQKQIAMQKRVIEKLKNQRDSYVREPMQTEYCATKVIEDLNMEIEAIERGQL